MTALAETGSTYKADLELGQDLADVADAITMARFLAADLRVETKPDLTPVTEADQATEHRLRELLAASRPADLVVGEEFGGSTAGELPGGRAWVIDPIDGTKNYVRGVPVWATLIALLDDGAPVVGIASAPALGRRWWAASKSGSWMRTTIAGADPAPRRLRVSELKTVGDSSFSYSDAVGWSDQHADEALGRLTAMAWRTRAFGDFYSHLLVAEGAVDIAAEPDLNIWDVAALIPIITEAGGLITGYDGSNALTAGSGVTTNGFLHELVLAEINRQ